MTAPMSAETRAVVDAVIEALAIPYAATEGHERTRQAILGHRARHLLVCMHRLADDGRPLEPAWHLDYLREMLAGHPPAGYVTVEQARERCAAGATWMQAVSLDYDQEAGR
jgi:hypothetical protein